MTTDSHCGDTCSVVGQMASAFKEFVPRETREASAIHAISVEKMTQRAAAIKFDIPQPTLSRRVNEVIQMNHPGTSQSEPAISATPETPGSNKPSPRTVLRKLCRDNNAPRGLGVDGQGVSAPVARGWLKWAGIHIPPELDGTTIPYVPASTPTTPTNNDTTHSTARPRQLFHRPATFENDFAFSENPAFADTLNIDAVRADVNRQVQQSNRPADFKRAIELLTELDRICTDAWYRRQPEPWGHDDWAHVSSEIEALFSIVGQRAEETANELLRQSSDVQVTATPVH